MTFENEMRESKVEDEGVYIPLVKFEQLIHAADGYRTALRGLRWMLGKECVIREDVRTVLTMMGETEGRNREEGKNRREERTKVW